MVNEFGAHANKKSMTCMDFYLGILFLFIFKYIIVHRPYHILMLIHLLIHTPFFSAVWMVFVAVRPIDNFPFSIHIFLSFRYFAFIDNIKGDENIRLSVE